MIIGREKETAVLESALKDNTSHFIAIYGRHRIGKTFLVRETFDGRFAFQHSGLYHGSLKEQLFAFTASLKESGYTPKKQAKNWLEAFEDLKDLIRNSSEKRKIIFLNELSWMDTPKSDFMTALENFWNGWASARRDIVLIICASATSWMISKVIHNKGGLYNRLTAQINLQPFSLKECEALAKGNGIVMSRDQILQAYMIMGGVPFYWCQLKRELSISQNIDELFFSRNALLKDEFKYLYSSIFKNPDIYLHIIEALSKKKIGMTRDELIKASDMVNSGAITTKLDELESCGFIRKYYAYGTKKKGAVYQLIDNFTIFYFKFMADHPSDEHFWTNQMNTPAVNTWTGLAFERVCLQHVAQIKTKLGISGVLTTENAWTAKSDPDSGFAGIQIDLLIVRKDCVINLCEMKYSGHEYVISEKTDMEIKRKVAGFIAETGTRYSVHPTLITTYGLVSNAYSGNIQSVVTMDDLFAF